MKKLIISVSVTLILFSSALFLLQENIITLKSKRIKDVIGRNVEEKYFEKTDIMVFGLKRFIGITEKKLDFLLKTMEPGWLIVKGGDKKARLFFAEIINSDPYCKRIRIVNTQLEILFSTAPQDVPRSKLNVNLYGSLFKNLAPDASRVVVDPILEMLIFYKIVAGGKGERYAVLFYYSQDALEGVFARIEGLNAGSFLITQEKIMLVNFPEIDESEQVNLSNLVQVISQNESGALRVIMKGMDKTIYYKRLQGKYTDWTMGLTLDTEHLRISRIGMLILVVQALVIVSVLLFIVFSLSKRGAVPPSLDEGARIPKGAAADASLLQAQPAGEGTQSVEGPRGGAETVGLVTEAHAGEAVPAAMGVMSLSDIEELVNVEEIGEAEVAGAVEEVEEAHEMESFGAGELEEEPGELEELGELEEIGQAGVPLEKTRVSKALEPEILEPEVLEPEPAEEVEELGVLEEVGEEEPVQAPAAGGLEEAIVDDRGIGTAAGAAARAPGAKTLPGLEALAKAGRPLGEREEAQAPEIPPTIPEEMYREKRGAKRNDEISTLITKIEAEDRGPRDLEDSVNLLDFIKGSLRTVGITKGALLTQAEGGLYEPKAIFGLSKTTKKKLIFDGSESVYAGFLKKGKTLFIREKVFKSKEVAKKFDRADSSKIRSLIMSPVVKAGGVKGILLAGFSKGKKVDQDSVIEEIKKIKEVIVRLL